MMLIRKKLFKLQGIAIVVLATLFLNPLSAKAKIFDGKPLPSICDTVVPNGGGLPYPIRDRRGDFVSNFRNSTYDLKIHLTL
ncbi:MAG: hypothetical protein IPP48_01465 [Chitinophagaceae bacterium]|nr:hypothetical protein [Chitinophagaceae bacterium]